MEIYIALQFHAAFCQIPFRAGCIEGGKFFQLPQKDIKSNETRDIELARDK